MPIDLKRFLLERPPGGWPEEGRIIFDKKTQEEVRRQRETRSRWIERRRSPQTILPNTWKEDFRDIIYISGRDLDGEDKAWLDAFLDHEETKAAFQELLKMGARWTEDLFLHIFLVCKPSSFRGQKLDAILQNKDSAEKNRKTAIALSKYLKRVDAASLRAGEMFGTLTEVITRNLAREGITINSEQGDPDFLSRALAVIGESFGHHIRRSYRGPKFDSRTHWLAISLSSMFRWRFDGRPLVHIVAALRNSSMVGQEARETKDIENILRIVYRKAVKAGLSDLLPGPGTPPEKNR